MQRQRRPSESTEDLRSGCVTGGSQVVAMGGGGLIASITAAGVVVVWLQVAGGQGNRREGPGEVGEARHDNRSNGTIRP